MEAATDGERALLHAWRARRQIGKILALAASAFAAGYTLAVAISAQCPV